MKTFKIDRDSNVALYRQIADRLAADIGSGLLAPFARLPSEQDLMQRLGVSRITIRQALGALSREGLVEARQGKGTYVCGPVVTHELEELKGFYDSLVATGHVPETQLVTFDAEAPPDQIRTLFGIGAEPVMRLERVYRLHGHPFAVARAWLPPIARSVTRQQAARHPIYAILQTLLGRSVAGAEVGIMAHEADEVEAGLLALPPRSPVLIMERTSYAADGGALEHSRFIIRPESYRFNLSVKGPLAITRQIGQVGRPPPSARPGNTRRKKASPKEQ